MKKKKEKEKVFTMAMQGPPVFRPTTFNDANYRDANSCSSCDHFDDMESTCSMLMVSDDPEENLVDSFCVCDIFRRKQ
jgi:hypothetical protein